MIENATHLCLPYFLLPNLTNVQKKRIKSETRYLKPPKKNEKLSSQY